jgi:hypothetical protein
MRVLHAFLLSLSVLAGACASNRSSDVGPAGAGGATVHIENQAAYDMDIYVHRQDGPVRLGFAPSKQTTRFTLAPGLITGSGVIRFTARPALGGDAVTSDALSVRPGDDLNWVIPPQ